MKNKVYSINDFLSDPDFIRWAKESGEKEETGSYWNDIVEKHPESREDFNKACEIAKSIQFKEWDVELSQFNRVLNNIMSEHYSQTHEKIRKGTRTRDLFAPLLRTAAMAALIVIAGLSVWFYTKLQKSDATAEEIQWIIKENPRGQKSTIHLPDSSRIILNSESRIRFRSDFMEDRIVELSGEAYFEVVKQYEQRFTVKTKNISIIVMGTSFNVEAFEDDEIMSVSLNTGRIVIEDIHPGGAYREEFILLPGEKIVFNKADGKKFKTTFDKSELLWKDGVLIFKQATLNDFINSIERWYNVKVEVQGVPDQEWKISGKFNNESLRNVLESLSFARKINYTLKEDSVTLNF